MRDQKLRPALRCAAALTALFAAAAPLAEQLAPAARAPAAAAAILPVLNDPETKLIQQQFSSTAAALLTAPAAGASPAPIDPARAEARFYAQRNYQPAWNDADNVRQLLANLDGIRADGLDPADYQFDALTKTAAALATAGATPAQRASFDLAATHAYITALLQLRRGKVDPTKLDRQWNFDPATVDPRQDLALIINAVNTHHISQAFEQAPPQNGVYGKMRDGLASLRAIQQQGGWPVIAEGPTLTPGTTDPRIAALRARLLAGGYIAPAAAASGTSYDATVRDAVKRFQAEQYLLADGNVGKSTLAALNVPVGARIDQVRVNLERARWLLHSLQGTFVIVDIAGYKISYYQNGQPVWRSRVQVGKPFRSTPVFQAKINYITFNPTWTVPPTIFNKDMLPKIRKNPGYLAANRIRVINPKGEVIPASSVDWSAPRGIMLRQDSGPDNSLGRVVIRFPNPYAVYLHDTPHKDLFSSDQRATSSGCIRVENPLELVRLLFNDSKKWSAAAINAKLTTIVTENVTLPAKVPLLLAYWTVDVTDDGRVTFKSDIYGHDAALLKALNAPARVTASRVLAPPSINATL